MYACKDFALTRDNFCTPFRRECFLARDLVKLPYPHQCLGALRNLRRCQILDIGFFRMLEYFFFSFVTTKIEWLWFSLVTNQKIIKQLEILIQCLSIRMRPKPLKKYFTFG
ncbi:hypothetical protein DA83_02950 [Pseudomonas sp. 250J]|nr:hypothetical protein DA83_02950 [Pseudomonas sp. 250J]